MTTTPMTHLGDYVPPASNAGQLWTKEEIIALAVLHQEYGPFGYYTPAGLSELHFKRSGKSRDHHAIYMAWTRYQKGVYDHFFEDA